MKRKLLSVLLAAALGVSTMPAQAQLSGDMVKIGVMTDMTGVYGDLGGQGRSSRRKWRSTISAARCWASRSS